MLFDRLVGAGEQHRRNVETHSLRRREVDDQLELARQLDRHVGGPRSFENPASVVAGTALGIGQARSVAHQAAGPGETVVYADGGEGVASRHTCVVSTTGE